MAESSTTLNVQEWKEITFEQQTPQDDDAETGLDLEVPLVLDKLKEQQLGSSEYRNTAKRHLHEPRSLVAAYDSRHFYFHVHFSHATYGLYRSKPACLVVLDLSFQKRGKSFSRFQAAEVDIEFRDAPLTPTATQASGGAHGSDSEDIDDDDLQPTVLAYEPRLFYGPVDVEKGSAHATAKLGLTPPGGIAALGLELGRQFHFLEEGFFKAHGTLCDNPQSRVHLSLSENALRRSGIREEVSAALVVGYVPGRRFSARVTVRADLYLNPLTPVCGEKDEPIYFDPESMMASAGGSKRARTVPGVEGDLDNVNLLQKLTRLGQYGGVFIREIDP